MVMAEAKKVVKVGAAAVVAEEADDAVCRHRKCPRANRASYHLLCMLVPSPSPAQSAAMIAKPPIISQKPKPNRTVLPPAYNTPVVDGYDAPVQAVYGAAG